MTRPMTAALRFLGRAAATVATALVLLLAGCGTEGSSSSGYYGDTYYNEDSWYWYGCCADRPDEIGPPPPHPEHPIALPPGSTPRPEHPIANPSPPRPTQPIASPSPQPRAAVRGGGGFRGGGGSRGGSRGGGRR